LNNGLAGIKWSALFQARACGMVSSQPFFSGIIDGFGYSTDSTNRIYKTCGSGGVCRFAYLFWRNLLEGNRLASPVIL